MTYAVWDTVVGWRFMFGASLLRYRRSLMRRREIRWLEDHHVLDRLRKQFGR
ncbi:hypothetical protein SAMN05446934_9436 [Paraburkholderia hospita]|nr:hypothetical protein SAMN05446934_9436 [Paraburkholderia hospita]